MTRGGYKLQEGSNIVFWDVTPCGSCKNKHFGGTYRLHHQDEKNQPTRKTLSVTNKCSMLQRWTNATRSSETSVVIRATMRHIPEDNILHSRFREIVIFLGGSLMCYERGYLSGIM
jgi:hypothetical protein